MRAAAILLALALTLAHGARAQSAGVQVTPVIVEFPLERGLGSIRVRNGRDVEVAFEAEVMAWTQHNGEDLLTPASDMILAPSVFVIGAGEEQIVRLALTPSARSGGRERAFRLILRELPRGDAPANGVRVMLQMSLPVFIAPRMAAADIAAQRSDDDAVTLANHGTQHVRLVGAAFDGEALSGLPRYLLAGSQIVRTPPIAARAIDVTYLAPDAPAPITVSIPLAPGVPQRGVR